MGATGATWSGKPCLEKKVPVQPLPPVLMEMLAQHFRCSSFSKETENLDYVLNLSNCKLCSNSHFFDPTRIKIHTYLLPKCGPGVSATLTWGQYAIPISHLFSRHLDFFLLQNTPFP